MEGTAAVILAAGKGTRLKSKTPKVLHRLWGKTLLEYIVDACRDAGVEDVIVVVGFGAEQVKEAMGDRVRYAYQAEQKGTGDALKCARNAVPETCRCLLVLPGDAPLVTGDHLRPILEEHLARSRAATVVTAELDDAKEYGRIVRQGDHLRIVEAKGGEAPQSILDLREFNTAVYLFDPKQAFSALERVGADNPQGEYLLTDVIGLLSEETGRVSAYLSPETDVWLGPNDRADLAAVGGLLRERIMRRHMLDGVTIVDPTSTFIDSGVTIGQDTTVHPGSVVRGETVIGEECEIGPYALLENARIGNGAKVTATQIIDSKIGDGTRCGPWSHLRPGCTIGENVKIGNFVEIKNTTVADKVSIGHVSYIGDAALGTGANIGAGLITCNYDGQRKHPTSIGANAFIGSHNTLVAPITVGAGAYTAAGSTLTQDVPADALAIGRARQTNKPDWRREKPGDETSSPKQEETKGEG